MSTSARVDELRRLGLMDSPPDESFDRITRLAAQLIGVSAVFISLLDDERDFFLSQHGFPLHLAHVREILGDTMSRHTLEREAPLLVEDARSHPLFRSYLGALKFGVGAFAGVPLRLSNGITIGVFSAIHAEAHAWTAAEVAILEDFAATTVTEIELRDAKRAADVERRRYHELVEGLDAIVWETDIATSRFTYVSEYAVELLGYGLAEWEDPDFWRVRLLHPDDREHAVAYCNAAALAGQDHSIEYRVIAADGRIVWLHDRARVRFDAAGKPAKLRGVMIDMTERKRAADAVRESEAKFQQIAEHVRELFWIFSPDFSELIFTSSAYERMWGRSVESLYADPRSFLDAVHPDDIDNLLTVMRDVAQLQVEAVEYRIILPDGEVRWMLSRGFPVRDENGVVYRIVGTTEDITRSKRLQDEARLLSAALHSLEEGILIARYDGQVIFANATHARLLGYDLESRPLPNMREFAADEESVRRLDNAVKTAIETGSWSGRTRRRTADGRVVPIGLIIGRVDDPEGGGRLFVITRDVSDDIRKEQHLRRAERLASVGTLIGGVAHELNNPLHAINNFASLLLDTPRPDEEREDLEVIRREALRAAKIVSDLRLLARQTQNEGREHQVVDMNEVIQHVIRTRSYGLATHNIEVNLDLAHELPCVWSDISQMEQVVINLVVNAEQAMAQTTGDRHLTIRTRATLSGIALHVEDTGPGIAPELLDRVFDPFFTTKAPGEGTGLGLSLVHNIITEHGGVVQVESELGRGTSFRVDLPRARTDASTASPGAAAPRSSLLHILVVDDEPAIRRALSRYLARRGHDVHVAGDGAEALTLIGSTQPDRPYDIILSDLRMPGLGGEQLLEKLKEQGAGMDRRVIFLTGDAASGDAARILAASNSPVIFKPVELAELVSRIERHAFELSNATR